MSNGNFIIHQYARQYQWSGDCFLSIKSFYNGTARYSVKQRQYSVNDSNYLILNECTRYNLVLDHTEPIESFCVFFSPEFVGKTISDLGSSDEQLLDDALQKTGDIQLLERNFRHGGNISEILRYGRGFFASDRFKMEKEEFYHDLLTSIIVQNSSSLGEAFQLTSKKKSTREELYRRLYYAKDFMDCNYTEDLTLKKLAEIAQLSENHFLRNFRQVFDRSPFQYLTELKINEAKRQLLQTDKPISTIAADVGYSSLSNFSHYFKTRVGVSPTALRIKGDI